MKKLTKSAVISVVLLLMIAPLSAEQRGGSSDQSQPPDKYQDATIRIEAFVVEVQLSARATADDSDSIQASLLFVRSS